MGRSPEESAAIFAAVGYELFHCLACAAILRDRPDVDPEPLESGVLHNALLEAHLIHARNLIELLVMEPGKRPSDVRRTDFLPEGTEPWGPGGDAEQAARRLEAMWKPINKHLTHITWNRLSGEGPEWSPGQISEDILHLATDWVEYLRKHAPQSAAALAPHLFLSRQAWMHGL